MPRRYLTPFIEIVRLYFLIRHFRSGLLWQRVRLRFWRGHRRGQLNRSLVLTVVVPGVVGCYILRHDVGKGVLSNQSCES